MGSLFEPIKPPPIDGIDLRCCGVDDVLNEAKDVGFVHIDPPWLFRNGGNGRASGHYDLITMDKIANHFRRSFDCAREHTYCMMWATFPTLVEWFDASRGIGGWEYISGGAWTKPGPPGTEFHWRGNAEAILLYRKGNPQPRTTITNALHHPRTEHSEKPLRWLEQVITCFSDRTDLVLDLYAGMAPLARACLGTGRRYIGAEIDPDRWTRAMVRLHRAASLLGCPHA